MDFSSLDAMKRAASSSNIALTVPIRDLIEEIKLVPENGTLRVVLIGELAALINLANKHPRANGTEVLVTLVAGGRI